MVRGVPRRHLPRVHAAVVSALFWSVFIKEAPTSRGPDHRVSRACFCSVVHSLQGNRWPTLVKSWRLASCKASSHSLCSASRAPMDASKAFPPLPLAGDVSSISPSQSCSANGSLVGLRIIFLSAVLHSGLQSTIHDVPSLALHQHLPGKHPPSMTRFLHIQGCPPGPEIRHTIKATKSHRFI